MRLFIYLLNKQKDKKYVKDIQDEIIFHFFIKDSSVRREIYSGFPFLGYEGVLSP